MDLNPDHATTHQWYGQLLSSLGRMQAARREHERAHELDPLSVIVSDQLGYFYYIIGETDLSLEQYLRTLEIDPNFSSTLSNLALHYIEMDRLDEARKLVDRFEAVHPQLRANQLFLLSAILFVERNRTKAEEALAELQGMYHDGIASGNDVYSLPNKIAATHLRFGNTDVRASEGYLALHYDWNWGKAEEAFRRVIEKDRTHIWGYMGLSQSLTLQGKHEAATAAAKQGVRIDPTSAERYTNLTLAHTLAGEFQEAIEALEECMKLEPNEARYQFNLSWCYLRAGRDREALELARKLVGQDLGSRLHFAEILAGTNHPEEAETILEGLISRSENQYVPPTFMPTIYMELGKFDESLVWLEKALAEKTVGINSIRIDPVWEPLRADPRFNELLKKYNFPEN